jgi:hypothetical protein
MVGCRANEKRQLIEGEVNWLYRLTGIGVLRLALFAQEPLVFFRGYPEPP